MLGLVVVEQSRTDICTSAKQPKKVHISVLCIYPFSNAVGLPVDDDSVDVLGFVVV